MEDTTASPELQLGHSTEPNAEGTPDTGTATAGGISPGALLMGHPHFFGDWKEVLVNLTPLFSLGMALMSCITLYPQLNWTPTDCTSHSAHSWPSMEGSGSAIVLFRGQQWAVSWCMCYYYLWAVKPFVALFSNVPGERSRAILN